MVRRPSVSLYTDVSRKAVLLLLSPWWKGLMVVDCLGVIERRQL